MSSTTNSRFDLNHYSLVRKTVVEQRLGDYLSHTEPAKLWESIRYSVLSGGKRLRALLCIASAELIRGEENTLELVLPCACAIELVHAMSLVHDDLPALDNDDYRRGKLTNHKVFGEAIALLAGDALLMLAIEVLIKESAQEIDRTVLLDVVQKLAKATGADGMVGGQVDDILYTGTSGQAPLERIDEKMLSSIHRRKTGALIQFSIWSGARLANANEQQLIELARFGEILGLAFQIADDLLDVTGDISVIGKTPGKDKAAEKATWVTIFGADGAKQRLRELEVEGENLLSKVALANTSALNSLLKYAIHRNN